MALQKSCASLTGCGALVLSLLAGEALAQPPSQMVYLNTTEEQERQIAFLHEPFAALGGELYFTADDGVELWKTDGTEAGTVLVKDILPGTADSGPFRLAAVGSTLFFVANSGPGDRNQELWKSDGSAAGTVLVEDIRPGEEPSGIDLVTPVNGRLFFVADDGTHGRELWVSDGTEA